jgi:hypothetical protein
MRRMRRRRRRRRRRGEGEGGGISTAAPHTSTLKILEKRKTCSSYLETAQKRA